jgi:hypothetical protein
MIFAPFVPLCGHFSEFQNTVLAIFAALREPFFQFDGSHTKDMVSRKGAKCRKDR